MQPGRMDRRVIFQQKVEPQDEFGAPTPIWSDQFTLWAMVKPVRGGERFQAEGLETEVTTEFQVRYSSLTQKVTPKFWRVVYAGQNYDIEEKQELGRGDGFKFLAVIREYDNDQVGNV